MGYYRVFFKRLLLVNELIRNGKIKQIPELTFKEENMKAQYNTTLGKQNIL